MRSKRSSAPQALAFWAGFNSPMTSRIVATEPALAIERLIGGKPLPGIGLRAYCHGETSVRCGAAKPPALMPGGRPA